MASFFSGKSKKSIGFAVIIVLFVFLWSFGHSFFGVDLVDTGAYLYSYLHPLSDYISYSTYLGTLTGAAWLRLFPSLGLWGLNLLELLLEYTLCVIVYLTFRKTFRQKSLLIGLAFCMIAISTYVNTFNYHQLSMFFCTSMLCFMYTGLRKNHGGWQLLAGACSALAVFSRFPCVLTLVCLLCIVYWRVLVNRNFGRMLLEVFLFLVGFAAMAALFAFVLSKIGALDRVVSDVFRISNLGEASSGSYNVNGQMGHLLTDTLHSTEAALLFIVCCCVIGLGIYMLSFSLRNGSPKRIGKIMLSVLAFLASLAIGLPGAYFAIYYVGKAPAFIQLTSFSWFLYGMLFVTGFSLSLAGIISALRGRFSPKHDTAALAAPPPLPRIRTDASIGFMGIALVLLCFVGSAARSKHAILGMWILAPLVIDRFFDLLEAVRQPNGKDCHLLRWVSSSCCAMAILFLCAFGWFVAHTNNFDDPNLTQLTTEINSHQTRFLKTSQREAAAVNEVLDAISPYSEEGDYLMVIGNPVMFYALTDMPSYIRPWVTGSSYMLSELKRDMNYVKDRRLPVIIEAKTNPYLGFAEDTYDQQLADVKKVNDKSSKVAHIRDFMELHSYDVLFENDYFSIFVPES